MHPTPLLAAGTSVLALSLSTLTAHAVTVHPDFADAHIGYHPAFPNAPVFQNTGSGHTLGANGGFVYVFVLPFALPPKAAFQSVSDATLRFEILRNSNAPGYNGDVYGLAPRATPAVQLSDYFVGPSDAASTLVGNDVVRVDNTDINNYVTLSLTGPALVNYLNAAYALSGPGSFAFFRVNPDATPSNVTISPSYFAFGAESGFPGPNNDHRPTLDITFIPAPSAALPLAALGLAARRPRR